MLKNTTSMLIRRAAIAGGLLTLGVLLPLSVAAAAGLTPGDSQALQAYVGDTGFPDLHAALQEAASQGADPGLLEGLVRGARDGGIPAGTLASWVRHAGRLAADRLPESPVVSRYLQGVAKNVPVDRIEGAVTELETRLTEAAALVDAACPAPTDPAGREARLRAIDHTAYALGLGVAKDDLDHSLDLAMHETVPVEAAQAPVLTLGILVSSGIPADKSVKVIDAAWSRGYRGDDLERLGKAVGGLGREGNAPAGELVDRVVALIDQEPSRDRVFQGLDDLMGHETSRVPPITVGDDPTLHRGDQPKVKDPQDSPKLGGDQGPSIHEN
jgi:hypothetical protein